METSGLWNYIQKEFQREGRADQFNKPAVKVCVYSSFFGGGVKAMRTGILEPEDAGFSTQTISGSWNVPIIWIYRSRCNRNDDKFWHYNRFSSHRQRR